VKFIKLLTFRVLGSSAGAMIMPNRHILLTRNSITSYRAVRGDPIPRMEGSRLFDGGLVDSHFSERFRQGRLNVFAHTHRVRFGFGIDEDSGVLESYKDKSKTFMGAKGTVGNTLIIY
jgi:cyanophycinase-like exopeptidase